jgi:cell division protein FtsL
MTKFIITKFRDTDRTKNTTSSVAAFTQWGRLNIILLLLITFVAISYLYYINQTATGGFDIKGMENRIEQLNKDNKQLEVKAAAIQSLSVIEQSSAQAGMVATTKIEYLPAVGSSVAVR